MNSVPFNYGYCNIQFPWQNMPSHNVEGADFKVDSESKVNFEEIALSKENVDYGIVKKIIGYRVNLDLTLYSYYLNGGTNYGWQRIKNCQFRASAIGDTHNTPIPEWRRPSADAADLIISADDTYQKCLSVSDVGSSAYKYTYNNIRTLCASKTYRFYYYVKGASGTYKVKLRAWAVGNTDVNYTDVENTDSLDGNWSSLQYLDITVPATLGTGDYSPNLLQALLYSTSAGGTVSYAYPRLTEKSTRNQFDLLEFLYYYRQCNSNDKAFWIYPYVGGDNFWSAGYRTKVKFIVIPESIEVLDNISRDKRLGQKIHLIAKAKNIISKSDFNYLTYRDGETDNFYYEPYGEVYVAPSKASQGQQDIFYVEKNT